MPRPPPAASHAWLVRLIFFIALQALVALAAPGEAHAQSCTSQVTDGAFGNVDGLAGGAVNTTATLTFNCTGLVPFVPVTLCPNVDGGSGGGDGSAGRLMANGAATIPFQIYQDSGRTQAWGSTSFLVFGNVPTLTATPGSNGKVTITRTLYARAIVPTTAKPGAYTATFANQNFFWGLNLLTCGGVTVGFASSPPAFQFRLDVDPGCTISASAMNFGAVGLLAAQKTAENTVSVRCTTSTAYTVGLDNGQNGASPTARRLARGGERVTYGIYKDVGHTQPWGDASAGLSAVWSGIGNGVSQPYTGYGLAPPQTTPTPGAYADTIVATITY